MAKQALGGRKVTRWNTNKEGGWDAYSEMTKYNPILKDIAEDDFEDSNKLMTQIDKELDSIRFKSFGKTKEKSNLKISKEVEALQKEKVELCNRNEDNPNIVREKLKEIYENMSALLLQKQRENFEKELKDIREMRKSKGKAAAVFNLKEKIVGSKSVGTEAVVIVDPNTKKEVYSPNEIKRVALEYCSKLLTNRQPKDGFEEDIVVK